MELKKEVSIQNAKVRVAHDLQRQILEMTSFLRVLNNYYKKKTELYNQIKPLILSKYKEESKLITDKKNWIQNIPTALSLLDDKFLRQENSFKFPTGIILFEAWMHLGIQALYPRFALHFQFPGFLKGEKTRNVFLFLYSTSRGFGFPLYFGPDFYQYKFKLAYILDPLLKWSYTVCHRANQAIVIGNKRLKSKRHHPGEFESVIISEFEHNIYKGIDTILHGYFKNVAKILGTFNSLDELLREATFFYSIGDHAMRIERKKATEILSVPLITHEEIVKTYGIDFNLYVKSILDLNKILIRKINLFREKRNNLISDLKKKDKFKFRMEQSKHTAKKIARISRKLSKKYPIIDRYTHYKTLLEKLRELLFIKPLIMHANSSSEERGNSLNIVLEQRIQYNEFRQVKRNSVLLSFIKNYEKKNHFKFEEDEVLDEIEQLCDILTKIWIPFKEKHFKFAIQKLNELISFKIDKRDYQTKINELLDTMLPIIAIYEIFNRPLFESVYPEAIPQTKRFWIYFARFLASKYNPIGTRLMKLFNRLAFQNWSYLIIKKEMNRREFFTYLLKLPIWKYISVKLKTDIINLNKYH